MSPRLRALANNAIQAEAGDGSVGRFYRAISQEPGGAAAAINSPITVTWVAPNGNDGTGTRGRIDKPFLTVQAALAAVVSGDLLWIAPGNYAENVVVPPALTALEIFGLGATISPATGVALTYAPAVSGSLRVFDIAIDTRDGNSAVNAIEIDGGAGFTTTVFRDAQIGRSNYLACASNTFIDTAFAERPRFVNCTDASFRGACTVAGADPLQVVFSPGGRPQGTVTIKGASLYSGLELIGQPVVDIDQATSIERGRGGAAINATALTISNTSSPRITFKGSVKAGAVNITFAPPTGIASNVLDVTGADFADPVSVAVSAPTATRAQVKASGATFRGALTVGESVDAEASNASLLGGLIAVGSGAANRPVLTPTVVPVGNPQVGPIAVVIPGPPMLDANYQVVGEIDAAGILAPAVFNKTATGFDVGINAAQTAGGNFTFTILRNG
jgi:hypothetical protein